MTVEAFPLQWPAGWPRTRVPQASRFKQTPGNATKFLCQEVANLGGTRLVVSSNLGLRRDGLPYAGQPRPRDCGVAAYFQYRGKGMVFACDRYAQPHDNIYAIGLTIEALRGIERWGASQMLERAFAGFAALPAAVAKREWWEVLGVAPSTHPADVREAWKAKAKIAHPDRGGSHEAMAAVNEAYDAHLLQSKLVSP